MGLQPMGKVPDLRRLAGRVASRSTVRWSWLRMVLGFTCTVTASQPGDDQYAPADPVTGSFPVQKIPQMISFSPPASATADQPVALTATASSGLPVTYTSSTPDVCTVSGTTATATRGYLHHYRLPARRRRLRASPARHWVLLGPEDPADDQLHAPQRRRGRSAGGPVRVGDIETGGIVHLGHPERVHGLRQHRHHHQGRHLCHHCEPGSPGHDACTPCASGGQARRPRSGPPACPAAGRAGRSCRRPGRGGSGRALRRNPRRRRCPGRRAPPCTGRRSALRAHLTRRARAPSALRSRARSLNNPSRVGGKVRCCHRSQRMRKLWQGG
jgi:hypothetical protein